MLEGQYFPNVQEGAGPAVHISECLQPIISPAVFESLQLQAHRLTFHSIVLQDGVAERGG